jgi:hypothetical protein
MFVISAQDDGTNYASEIRLSLGDLNQQQGDLTQRSRPRTRLTVASDGAPSLEFLDEAGNVTHREPPAN